MASSSGAIPKVKGGARPKTKSLANGGVQNGVTNKSNLNNFTLNPKHLPKIKNLQSNSVEDFSISTQTEVSHCQPLDKKEIHITDDGVEVKRPGLSPEWVEKRTFIHYTRPPVEGELVVGAVDAWVEQMEFLLSDLTWLLGLPHHKFWSQVVFDKSVHECLQYYLTEGPRWYDTTIFTKDETCLSLLNSIHQLVFLIFVRMATFKESKNDHITPSVFGDLIYDNFIYDICKILDLCILYGSSNSPLLERLISSVFTHQPKYFNDLNELSLSLFSVLKNLEEKLGVSEGTLVPCSLACEESKVSLEELGDVIEYMMDCFCSLQAFLTIFPKACETFHEKDLELRLSSFYERAVPKLVDHLTPDKDMQRDELEIKCEMREKLEVVRLSILTIFREILTYICLPTKESTSDLDGKTLSQKIESFSHILTSSVEEKIFITDYNASFDLGADILYFKEKGADLTTLTFIKEAVESIVSEVTSTMAVEEEEELIEDGKGGKLGDTSGMNGYYAGQTNSLSPVEVESLVSGVQDLFPELGSGFIKECLRYYSFSGEEVLNAILEDNLPPCLDALDRSMKEILESSTTSSSRSLSEESSQNSLSQKEKLPDNLVENQEEIYDSGTLSNRLNIYDDDEFDVFRKPTGMKKEKIHKGKATQSRNLYEKDPELTQKMKNIVEQYEVSQGYSIYEDELKYTSLSGLATSEADYNDEYDDTYADNETGDVDSVPTDGQRFERIPTIWGRGALNTPALNFVDEEEDEETLQGESEFRSQMQMREGGDESSYTAGRDKSQHSEGGNFRAEKFKRANASHRRVYADREEEWNSTQTLSFTNSSRGGRGGPRRSVPFREDNSNISETSETSDQQDERNFSRPSFVPFCENPEDTRRRMERRRQNKQFRNKGYYPSSSDAGGGSETTSNNTSDSYSQKSSTKTNKHSGKTWRQGAQESDEASGRRQQGGKYKEDTNHGKAQDRNFRHKMIHKNEQRRNAAQAKYRSNF